MNAEQSGDSEPLNITAPQGDHPVVVDHLAQRVIQIVGSALLDLDTVLSVHSDAAPTSAVHVQRYLWMVASQTLACVEGWPS